MVYIYESHLGGLYVKKYLIPNDILYCDECGDSDQLLLDTDNLDEVRDFLLSQVALFDRGLYSICHLNEIYDKCIDILGEDEEVE